MRPLRYSINVTLDGCCDHRAIVPDEALHRHALENIERADALLLGRATCELMEAGWRRPSPAMPAWMEPFARTIDAVRLAGHGPALFAGLSRHVDLALVSRVEFASGAMAMRYVPRG